MRLAVLRQVLKRSSRFDISRITLKPRQADQPALHNSSVVSEPAARRTVDSPVVATYLGLRLSHYRHTLKSTFRGLDKAIFAVVAALQFILTAIVTVLLIGMGQALMLLTRDGTELVARFAVIAAWQGAGFILLRALREATFMPRSRVFFEALPVRPADKLRADLLLSVASYSLLWLPVAWVLADPLHQARGSLPAMLAALLELAALSLCLNVTLLRGARGSAGMALCLLAYAFAAGGGTAPELTRAGCALLAAALCWRSYLPAPARTAAPPRNSAAMDGLARHSGLVVPLLLNELRSNLLVRLGFIVATLLGCLTVMRFRTNDTSTASVVVFVAAVAALALYTLPALCRSTLLGKLHFLAGQPAFAARMRRWLYAIPALLFVMALAVAWPFDHSGHARLDGTVFAILFVLGVIGARLRFKPTQWAMPFATMVSLIVLAAMT
jgi:hypothetical protein